ncbi:MAG: VCBS repeat-containing protein [Oscillospiraceae bacterium]|nr:VCBS repeat-containing protein [Oscillospiraceae bacterium]
MKNTWKTVCLAGVTLALAWLLGGCSAPSSAENLFTLPQLPIEYTDLAQQINTLIDAGYEYASPTSGRNIQSVQMVDLDGDGDEEAVVFFRKTSAEKPLNIFIFSAHNGTYKQLCTIESSGTAVESVYYRDLTGDKHLELVVGWRISPDVQTVAVYTVGQEPETLMQSSYVRYSIEELDGDGVPSLLIFRSDDEGNSVAEFYSRRDNAMTVSFSANLSSTMAELARGSVVSGRLTDGSPAVYVTGVTEENTAVTDILAYRSGPGLINVALDQQTGSSAVFAYMQLRPQDINGDGKTEVPCPEVGSDNQISGIVDWLSYDREGQAKRVMSTYHNISGGWYFILPEEWSERTVQVFNSDAGANELHTTLYVGGQEVAIIYALTGENQENRAMRGNRQVIKRHTGTTYAGEVLEFGPRQGLTETVLHQNFKLMTNQWAIG